MKCIVIQTSPERTNAEPVTNEDGTPYIYATMAEARAELRANGYIYNRANQRYYINGTEYRAYILREDSEEYAYAIERAEQQATPEYRAAEAIAEAARDIYHETKYCAISPADIEKADAYTSEHMSLTIQVMGILGISHASKRVLVCIALAMQDAATEPETAAEIVASIEDPEERAHIEREAAAHQWTPDETRANAEHLAEARRRTEARKERYRVAGGAAYDLIEAYEEATGEHVSEDSAEDTAAHHVAYADIAGAHYATARDYEIIDAMVEAIATVATRPRPVSNPIYQRHELEAFLGEYVDDYDVDAIEHEATEHDPHTGHTVWTPEAVRDLMSICERHELKA